MKNYQEQFNEAMACENKEQAEKWFLDEALRYQSDYGIEAEKAKQVILTNLGYMAGYYNQAASHKIHDLFGATHPIFGAPNYWTEATPEQAFEKGKEMADKVQ